MARQTRDPDFPCSLTISTPFPTYRLAEAALRALQVDEELSPLVRRSFTLVVPSASHHLKKVDPATGPTPAPPHHLNNHNHSAHCDINNSNGNNNDTSSPVHIIGGAESAAKTVLRTEYKAKTNRMLRVAVNGFMESLGVVLGVMEKLDVDVLANKRNKEEANAPAAASS